MAGLPLGGRWLPAAAILLLILLMFGGRIFDLLLLNNLAVKNMKFQAINEESATENRMLTAWGACRHSHLIGREYLLDGHYDKALPFLQEAIVCDDSWAFFDLGQAQYGAGEFEGAAESWRQTPQGYFRAVQLARTTEQNSRPKDAIAAWNFVLSVDPGQQTAYIELARLMSESDAELVEPLLRQAIEADPANPAAFIALGKQLEDQGERAEAQALYETAHELDPANVSLLMSLAENAAVLGNVAEAIDYWQEVAVRSQRRRALAYYRIGNLTLADNNTASALAFYKQALELEPGNGQFLLGLAEAYAESSCTDEAIQSFQAVMESTASEDLRQKARERLEELVVLNYGDEPCIE